MLIFGHKLKKNEEEAETSDTMFTGLVRTVTSDSLMVYEYMVFSF